MTIGELDPGIVRTVAWLRACGFETTDSGDGTTKPEEEQTVPGVPHVFAVVSRDRLLQEADRLHGLLVASRAHEVAPSAGVEASYSPADGVGVLALYGVSDAVLRAVWGDWEPPRHPAPLA